MLDALTRFWPLSWHVVWAASSSVYPPLNGLTRCVGSSGGSFYLYPEFYAHWDFQEAAYGWVAPLNCSFAGPECAASAQAYGTSYNWLHAGRFLMRWPNIEYKFKQTLPANVEAGFGAYLVPSFMDITAAGESAWTTRLMVGTRVSSASHTSCCYQFMSSYGTSGGFALTEYCIQKTFDAEVKEGSATEAWYRNSSQSEMNEETRHNCLHKQSYLEFSEAWMHANLPDNQTAFELWTRFQAEGRPGFVKPWVELYPEGYASADTLIQDDTAATIVFM